MNKNEHKIGSLITLMIISPILITICFIYHATNQKVFATPQDRYDSLPVIYKGDTPGYEVEVVDFYNDEDAYNITNYIIKLKIKPAGAGESYILNKSFTNTTPTSGIARLSLTAADTTYVNGLIASGEIAAGDYIAYFEKTNAGGTVVETMLALNIKFVDR